MKKINLVGDTIDKKDIDQLIEWLKTYPRLTKGEITTQFEIEWSKWLGRKHSVFVNSGSSANLLMLYALIVSKRLKNKKIVIPALSWATDLAPVIQLGLEPILADCNLDNLAVDVGELRKVFFKEKPAALLLVSVLGLSPHMKEIIDLCKEHGVILIEDNCESLGTEYYGQKLGTFGDMSSFSLYFGHHISTIEGGMISTDDDELYDILKMARSHGWDRDLDIEKQKQLREKWGIDEFSALYTFYIPGFNLRSTDLQAFLGLGQLKKLDSIIKKRNENYKRYIKNLEGKTWIPRNSDYTMHDSESLFISNFCMPIIDKRKDAIVKNLQKNDIETRPLICGSAGTQPFYVEKYGRLEQINVREIDKYGLYVPNHPDLTNEEIDFICDIIINS